MEIGGAERALLGLLYSFDYSRYEVDLYLCRHTGEFLKYLPNQVNLLPEDKNAASIAIPAEIALKSGRFGIVLGRIIGKYKAKKYIQKHSLKTNCVGIEYSNKYTYRFVKNINPALYKTKAKKRIAWMHTDYSFVAVDSVEGKKVWSQYDAIAAISEDCWKSFVKVYPELESKLFLIENINHPAFIKSLSEEFVASEMVDKGYIKLLSIGRYSYQKNFENIPTILSEIHKSVSNVKWYIIGYGNQEIEQEVRENAKREGVSDRVVLLGKKENPYPYIKACDIYVQPSRYEGKSITVREAQILCKPVIVTNYPTASSQIQSGVDGVIVPLEVDACAREMADFIRNKEEQARVVEYLETHDYGNEREIEKIYQLVGA